MQRITRDEHASPTGLGALEAKIALILKHFPPSVASVYAIPRIGSGQVLEWWSELGGQPTRFHDLSEAQQAALLARYHQRQASLGLLADELVARGEAEQAASLRGLIGPPDLNNLYSINGDPVVVRWGLKPPAPAAVTPPAAGPRPVVVRRLWRGWPWLFLGLLLLGLLLWALWHWRLPPMNLWSNSSSYACRAKAPSHQELPPEFVVILDTSGSMNLNINATKADEDWYFGTRPTPDDDDPRTVKIFSPNTRLDVAKASLSRMINNLHPDIDTRLMTFAGCFQQPDHGVFTAAQRPQLIAGIQGLHANEGTPLAASLKKAARKVDGRDRDAVIVMFVDGDDGFDQNVCKVAQNIAIEQPRLHVNVVNIGDSSLSNCIAENTGGSIYSSRNASDLADALQAATQAVSECE